MTEVISVRFRNGSKTYFFDPRGIQVRTGDHVIVQTAQGLEFASCIQGNHAVEDAAIVKPLNPIVRLATENDYRVVEYNRKKERDAFGICEGKIADHGLDMKLVSVSAGFDSNKIVFYFTADGRVDFRELVRDLASVFRARIELRQIGVRDEAKMIGGLGICGRPFCCSQFLDGFVPVSIKMAKTQNLSLNPTKISGTCGRLMCCLKYEQNAYEDAAKRMPKLESFVQTPDGPGNVKGIELLRERVKVSLDSAPENPKTYRACEIKILRSGKGSREGIEIPERTARYVEEHEEEELLQPVFAAPFYLNNNLEDAPRREKMGADGGKPRPRHRGTRRKNTPRPDGAASPPPKKQQPHPPKPQSQAKEGRPDNEGKRRRPPYRGRRWNKEPPKN
ncbi:MAG: stage 0 sporulation family protein [Oscillibacter sp.]|nr:stage 0 sporulation family protein [Oscillibacter sp.]